MKLRNYAAALKRSGVSKELVELSAKILETIAETFDRLPDNITVSADRFGENAFLTYSRGERHVIYDLLPSRAAVRYYSERAGISKAYLPRSKSFTKRNAKEILWAKNYLEVESGL